MPSWLRTLRRPGIRAQLIIGIAFVHAVMMSIFVFDLIDRERESLHAQSLSQTESLTNSLAVASVSWMLANDVAGLQEIVSSLATYPGVRYAMLLTPKGKVLAHNDPKKAGSTLTDPTSAALLKMDSPREGAAFPVNEPIILRNDRNLVDLAVPILANQQIIGWARVAVDQVGVTGALDSVTRNGVLYTALAIAIGTVFAILMAGRLTSSLAAVTRVADAFRLGGRHERVSVQGDDEVARLAAGFNAMLDTVSAREREVAASEERFNLAMRGANDGLWDWDLKTNTVYYSPRWKSMIGFSDEEVSGALTEWHDRVHPDDFKRVELLALDYLAGRSGSFEVEYRLRHREGHFVWILARGICQRDEAGHPVRFVGTNTDLSERKRLEARLRLDASVVDSAQEGILITDSSRRIIRVNRAFTEMTGYGQDEIIGAKPSILSSGLHDADFYVEMQRTIDETGSWRGEIWNRRKNGDIYAEILSVTALMDVNGRVENYLGWFTDITELKRTQQSLEKLANFDLLTGLPNRNLLNDRLRQALATVRRQGRSLAVCFVDLDGFKEVNDLHGHNVGDELLVQVAQRLSAAVRGSDTVARLGGDEFVLLLDGSGSEDELHGALNRVIADVAKPYYLSAHELNISASIGVSIFPRHHTDADVLIRYADQAMYRAKQLGRNRFHMFDADLDAQTKSRYQLVGRLRQAIEEDELRLYYQPKVDMREGRVIGLEALLRWQHPERGLVLPGEFLPLIEDTDLAIEVGDWVFGEVLRQLHQWGAGGLELPVSINIAAQELQKADFVERLQAHMDRGPAVSPRLLELEVLESAVMKDIGHARSALLRCREMGMSVAIDDFGTGYSSLSYLKHLPADVLKIDRSFIRDLLEEDNNLEVAKGVIGLGEVFHRSIVAEGVESAEHGLLLLSMGCTVGQGFGIARPMPAEAVPDWVKTYAPDPLWGLWRRAQWGSEDRPVLLGRYDHDKWVARVLEALKAESVSGNLAEVLCLDEHVCRFGRWYYGRGLGRYSHLSAFRAIEAMHSEVHGEGRRLVREHQARTPTDSAVDPSSLLAASQRFKAGLFELQRSVAQSLAN